MDNSFLTTLTGEVAVACHVMSLNTTLKITVFHLSHISAVIWLHYSVHEASLYVIKKTYFGIGSKLMKMTMLNKTHYIISVPLSFVLLSLDYHIWDAQSQLSLAVLPKIVHLEQEMRCNEGYRIM